MERHSIFGVEVYALMMDDIQLGRFIIHNNELKLELNNDIDNNMLPYDIKIHINTNNLGEALHSWTEGRLLQKDRIGIKDILKNLRIKKYNQKELFEATHASLMKDPYWIAFTAKDTYETCSQRGKVKNKQSTGVDEHG